MFWSINSCQNRISADQYHLTIPRAQVFTHRGRVFFWSYLLTNYQFQMIVGSSSFFPMIRMNMLCLCHYGPALLRLWFQTDLGRENSAIFLKNTGGEDLFFTMVTRWSRSTSNFYTLIGQNLTGEFMRKNYAASWKLFTLRAEADRVLCQLVMYLTVFSTGFTKWNTAAIRSLLLFMAGLFIGFLVEKCVACQNSVIRFRIASFSHSTLLNA